MGNAINISLDTEIGLLIDIDRVQGYENIWSLPELHSIERELLILGQLRLIPWTDVTRVETRAKDVRTIFGIRDPAGLGGIKLAARSKV